MSAITSLRNALEGVTNEVEDRVSGFVGVTENAALAFVSAILGAIEISVRQVVEVFFSLAQTFVTESFNVIDSAVTAALGVPTNEDEGVDVAANSIFEGSQTIIMDRNEEEVD